MIMPKLNAFLISISIAWVVIFWLMVLNDWYRVGWFFPPCQFISCPLAYLAGYGITHYVERRANRRQFIDREQWHGA